MATTQTSPMFTEQLINRICCSVINRLLASLSCLSTPINDLHELDDGVALVELIECFEDTMFVKLPQSIPGRSARSPISRTQARSNMEYVESWLKVEGISLDSKRSIREIFAEIRRSGQELANFMGTFSQDELNDGSSLASMLQKQRLAIYARSIAYISALCYAIFTIFLKHGDSFARFYPGYQFQVAPDELLHILFYTKWKLTEEELLLKDLELMRLKDSMDLMEIENRRLKDICQYYGTKRDNSEQVTDKTPTNETSQSEEYRPVPRTRLSILENGTKVDKSNQQNGSQENQFQDSPQQEHKFAKNSRTNSLDIESVSSITISSIAEMKTVATLTDIFGLDNEILVRYGFDKKLMEMKRDQEDKEEEQERLRAEQQQNILNQRDQQELHDQYEQNQSRNQKDSFGSHQTGYNDQQENQNFSSSHQGKNSTQQNQNSSYQNNQSYYQHHEKSQNDPDSLSHSEFEVHYANLDQIRDQKYHHDQYNQQEQNFAHQNRDSNSQNYLDQYSNQQQYDFNQHPYGGYQSDQNSFEYNKLQVELALSGKRTSFGPLSTVPEDPNEHLHTEGHGFVEQRRRSSSSSTSTSTVITQPQQHQKQLQQQQQQSAIEQQQAGRKHQSESHNSNQEAINSSSSSLSPSSANVIHHHHHHHNQPPQTTTSKVSTASHAVGPSTSSIHPHRLDNIDDEQLRNRILIARLLAELSYEKNKNMKSSSPSSSTGAATMGGNLRQTNQDYI